MDLVQFEDKEYEEFISQFVKEHVRGGPLENEYRLISPKDKDRISEKTTIIQNVPNILSFPLTFQPGDKVFTKEGLQGIVLAFRWFHNIVTFSDYKLMAGHFVCKVRLVNGKTKYFLNEDLKGVRFPNSMIDPPSWKAPIKE